MLAITGPRPSCKFCLTQSSLSTLSRVWDDFSHKFSFLSLLQVWDRIILVLLCHSIILLAFTRRQSREQQQVTGGEKSLKESGIATIPAEIPGAEAFACLRTGPCLLQQVLSVEESRSSQKTPGHCSGNSPSLGWGQTGAGWHFWKTEFN